MIRKHSIVTFCARRALSCLSIGCLIFCFPSLMFSDELDGLALHGVTDALGGLDWGTT